MASLNRVTLIGRLGKDPEIKNTQGGLKIANLRLATSETWRDKASGEKKERTEWHTVVCYNENLSKTIEQYCKKGSQIMVEGQLQTRKWTTQDGADRYATEVVMQGFNCQLMLLDSKGEGGGRDYDAEAGERNRSSNPQPKPQQQTRGLSESLDDDIPF